MFKTFVSYFPDTPLTFMILSHSVLLRMRNISDKSCRENQNIFLLRFFFKKSCLFLDNVGKNTVKVTVWSMRIACWMTKATNTHLEYVILITFPLQRWLHERTKMLLIRTLAVLFASAFSNRLHTAEDFYTGAA